jgi:hypothetical protein
VIGSPQSLHKAILKEDFEKEEFQKYLDTGGAKRLQAIQDEIHRCHHKDSPIAKRETIGNATYLTFPKTKADIGENGPINGKTHHEAQMEYSRSRGWIMRPLAESDDGPFYRVEDRNEFKWAKSGLKTFLEISKRETGIYGDPQKLQKKREENEKLANQSHHIAGILENNGVSAYRNDDSNVYIYSVHSQEVEKLPKFRRICFLPSVAASLRRPMVTALDSYLEEHPFCRMWTFTAGRRTKTGDLRDSIKKFHRRLSRFSSWLKTQGVEMVFRSTELGTPETAESQKENANTAGTIDRDANDEALFHIHSHCLVRLIDGPMNGEAWAALLAKVWQRWGNHWDDGLMRNSRELCKYVFKPDELLSLKDSELCELYHQLKRLKLVAPLGDLRENIKRRKELKLRLVLEPTPDGKVYREVKDWNRHLDKKNELEKALSNAAKAKLIAKPDSDAPKILARCLPGFAKGSVVKEPRVMVLAKYWQPEAVKKHPLVSALTRYTEEEYNAGICAARFIRVHTVTPTVHEQSELPVMIDVEERTRPPGKPIFEESEVLR